MGRGSPPAEGLYSQTSPLTLPISRWADALFFFSIPALFFCLTSANHEANWGNKAYQFIKDEAVLPEESTACHAWSLARYFLLNPLTVPAAFFVLLSFCQLQQVAGSEVWQLQLWPEGPASPVLAPGTSASHLISDLGSFSAPLCFPQNMEQRLTDRINFHCSFNSQLISLELHTLPLTTSTMLFQKLNFGITERHLGVFLASCHWSSKLGVRIKTQSGSFVFSPQTFTADPVKGVKAGVGWVGSFCRSKVPQQQQRSGMCWIPFRRWTTVFRWLHLNHVQMTTWTIGMKTLLLVQENY